jgi:hypothetical protein
LSESIELTEAGELFLEMLSGPSGELAETPFLG